MIPTPPLRCAQLIESLDIGGAENLAVRIANAMADRGHESHIVVIGTAGETARRISSSVSLHELGLVRASVQRPHAFVRSVARGRQAQLATLRKYRIQIVQSHLPGANFWGLLLAMNGDMAILPTVHNNREFDYGNADHWLRSRVRRAAYAAMARTCPAIIAVSAEVKQSLIADCGLDRRAARKLIVVRNGVEIPPLAEPVAREATRRMFGIPPDDFVFLSAGRHCEQKNLRDVIRAAGILAGDERSWTLVIAGDGPDRPALEEAARLLPCSRRIRFLGNVMELGALMGASDVFVLPSLWEGLPLVLLEAMAHGLPVIGNRIPGIADVIADGREGVLTAPGDPMDLARGMRILLHDAALGRSYGLRARAAIEQNFDQRTGIASLESIYRECATK
jgi:glycosyltransferase involved in cell wall biosynthesis